LRAGSDGAWMVFLERFNVLDRRARHGILRGKFDRQMAHVEERGHRNILAAPVEGMETVPLLQSTGWENFYCPKISGSPFLLFPITTTFELTLLARFSVASIPFHSSSCGLMP